MTTVQNPTKPEPDGRENPRDWTTLFVALGGLAGSAAWVGVLGTAVMWQRLTRIGVPPAPAVAELPNELRIVLGLRYLVVPLGLALLAYMLLVVTAGRDQQGPESKRHYAPPPKRVLAVVLLLIVGVGVLGAMFTSGLSTKALIVALFVVVGSAVLTYGLMRRTDNSFLMTSVVFFAAVLVTSGGCALFIFEGDRSPKFNVAALVRNDNSALGGFLIGRSDTSVLMVVPQFPDGQAIEVPSRAGPRDRLSTRTGREKPRRCRNAAAALDAGSGSASERCYVNRLVIVASDKVDKLIVGPRGQRVNLDSYALADWLAELARARPDEAPGAPVRGRD